MTQYPRDGERGGSRSEFQIPVDGMTRGIWVCTPEGLIPKHLYHKPISKRSELSAPMLIRDTMEPTLNHADGQRYDSKRAYEKAVRRAGCVIVGNETQKHQPESHDVSHDDVKAAIEQVESRSSTVTRKRKSRGR